MTYKEPEPPIEGWMNIWELIYLYEMARQMESIVEIGSWLGKSTHALLSGCKGTVYAVDHFQGSPSEIDAAHVAAKTQDIHAIFLKNVGHFKNLVTLKMESQEAAKLFEDKSVDMGFIDGDHKYPAPKNDIETWLPKCRKLICGHDSQQDGVPRAINELGLKPVYLEGGSIWSIKL
jgi:predicted O-methyltransferase YrrM